MMRTRCRNTRCNEPLPCATRLGFCSSCRFAIWLGFKSATTLLTVLGALLAVLKWVSR